MLNEKPWALILFKRNIINFKQTKNLTQKIRSCMKDPFYPILIDEEGGRVSRLKKIVDNSIFSGKFFGDLYKKNKKMPTILLDNNTRAAESLKHTPLHPTSPAQAVRPGSTQAPRASPTASPARPAANQP